MPKTKIKSIFLFTAMVLVVSGCGRELKIKNEELGIKDSGEMGGLVKQVATTTGEDLGVASSSDEVLKDNVAEINTSDWLTYENDEYGFRVKYPNDWYLFDCSYNNDISSFLRIKFSYDKKDDCDMPLGHLYIVREDNNLDFKKEFDNYKNSEIKIKGVIAKKIEGNVEIKGGEGEMLKQRPVEKIIKTFIPYKNYYFDFEYSEIYKFLGTSEGNGFVLDKNYQKVYNEIVSSFEFID